MSIFKKSSEHRSKVQAQLDNERQPQPQAECESCGCAKQANADLHVGHPANRLTFQVEVVDGSARP